MNELTTLHKAKDIATPVIENLQSVLTNTYGLYLATHNYHWNVEGSNFVSLHKLFDEQYNELFKAVDVIAERIRALDCYAVPFEESEIAAILKATSSAMNKNTDANERAIHMVHNLIKMNESVLESCQCAKKEGQEVHDDESESLMVERITVHQKALWMLRSVIK